jgi:predicted nucleic acid-binding protein
MPLPDKVLIDTSAFYALLAASDTFHTRASATFDRIADRDQEMWTTSYVLVESMALVHRRLGFQALEQFVGFVRANTNVIWIESLIHAEAERRLLDSRGAGLSFVDWTVALASNTIGAHVFTFDSGFANQGVPVLPT